MLGLSHPVVRWWRAAVVGSVVVAACASAAYNWQPVVWGGGGYVTGFVFHPTVNGLLYARTDVGGAYRRDPGSRTWNSLSNTLPRKDGDLNGILSLAVDRNNPNLLYMAAGMYTPSWARNAAILRSSDRGLTWSRTELTIRLGGNEDGRGQGERLQVDPNLGSVLLLGTSADGLWKSTDAGVTWARVTAFPAASTMFVTFNRSSSVIGTATRHIYVGVATTTGTSLYQSKDAGATWAAVPNLPTAGFMPMAAAMADGDRKLYLTFSNAKGPNGVTDGRVYSYDDPTGVWTNLTPETANFFGYAGISVSALAPSHIAVSTLDRWGQGDEIFRSMNGGRTWTAVNAISTHEASDYDWMSGWANTSMGHWITDVEFDPFAEGHLIHNHGQGIWETDNFLCTLCDFHFAVRGFEETVVLALVSPPSGAHLLASMGDVGGGRYDTDFTRVQHFVNGAATSFSLDYAHWWPNFLARTVTDSSLAYLSWDNGVTWSPVPNKSPVQSGMDCGTMAVSANGGALVWVPGKGSAFYSTDNGATWTASTGYPVTDSVSSGGYQFPIADRLMSGTFYTYDFIHGTILESVDSGKSFHVIYSGLAVLPTYASTHQLTSLPTQTRDLWLASPAGLFHIAGTTTTSPIKIAAVQSATGIGYGAAATGATYPALYLSGTINNVQGFYQSIDAGATWTRIDDDQHLYNSNRIIGDQRIFGRVYIAPNGRGLMLGNPV